MTKLRVNLTAAAKQTEYKQQRIVPHYHKGNDISTHAYKIAFIISPGNNI